MIQGFQPDDGKEYLVRVIEKTVFRLSRNEDCPDREVRAVFFRGYLLTQIPRKGLTQIPQIRGFLADSSEINEIKRIRGGGSQIAQITQKPSGQVSIRMVSA